MVSAILIWTVRQFRLLLLLTMQGCISGRYIYIYVYVSLQSQHYKTDLSLQPHVNLSLSHGIAFHPNGLILKAKLCRLLFGVYSAVGVGVSLCVSVWAELLLPSNLSLTAISVYAVPRFRYKFKLIRLIYIILYFNLITLSSFSLCTMFTMTCFI